MFGNQRGMTLLEIIIVVSILATLTAIFGTVIQGRARKARQDEARIQIAELSKALDLYYTDCSRYPSSDEGFSVLTKDGVDSCPSWGPEPYIKKIPKDPWGRHLEYYYENGSYTIVALGEDGKEGGTGYDKDITSDD